MCDEREEVTPFDGPAIPEFEQYHGIYSTGKPAFRPPGTPRWRRLLDHYW